MKDRELDMKIAGVMGWKWDQTTAWSPSGGRYAQHEGNLWWLPRYSSNWEDTMQVRDRVHKLIFSKRQTFIRSLTIIVSNRIGLTGAVVHDSELFLHVQPDDICRAALEVLDSSQIAG